MMSKDKYITHKAATDMVVKYVDKSLARIEKAQKAAAKKAAPKAPAQRKARSKATAHTK